MGSCSSAFPRQMPLLITFTDNATCYTMVYLMATKGDTLNCYWSFEAWAHTQCLCKEICIFHSDYRGKYLSAAFDKHLANAGTACRLTVHDTPQLNGIAERLNCMLMEKVQALLHASRLPQTMWGEALRHSTVAQKTVPMFGHFGKTDLG